MNQNQTDNNDRGKNFACTPPDLSNWKVRPRPKGSRRRSPTEVRAVILTEDLIDRIPEHNPRITDWKRRLIATRDRLRRERERGQNN